MRNARSKGSVWGILVGVITLIVGSIGIVDAAPPAKFEICHQGNNGRFSLRSIKDTEANRAKHEGHGDVYPSEGPWYADSDGDLLGDPDAPQVCPGVEITGDDYDCDDGNDTILGPTEYFADADGDTYVDASTREVACTLPPGKIVNPHPGVFDCADDDAGRYPGAEEVLNGLDDDCDGDVDEGVDPCPCYGLSAPPPEDAIIVWDDTFPTSTCTDNQGIITLTDNTVFQSRLEFRPFSPEEALCTVDDVQIGFTSQLIISTAADVQSCLASILRIAQNDGVGCTEL